MGNLPPDDRPGRIMIDAHRELAAEQTLGGSGAPIARRQAARTHRLERPAAPFQRYTPAGTIGFILHF